MKRTFIALLLLLWATALPAQDNDVENLLTIGIALHDAGKYEEAIAKYKEALLISPGSSLVNYEIAFSYSAMGEHEKAIEYANRVVKAQGEYLRDAYMLIGSNQDDMGQPQKAIGTYKKAIKQFPDYSMLYLNLGITYHRIGDYKNASDQFTRAIQLNPYHPSNHLYLAYSTNSSTDKAKVLYCFYYFLLLEPDSPRAADALTHLNRLSSGNVYRRDDGAIQIDISNESAMFDFMQALSVAAARLEDENGDGSEAPERTEEEIFIDQTRRFFTLSGPVAFETSKSKRGDGLWEELYLPFFRDMAATEHLEAFCYYIMSGSNEIAAQWLDENQNAVSKLFFWINRDDEADAGIL